MNASTVSVIVTDFGEVPAPEGFMCRHAAARKRKDGAIDRRFAKGRQVLKEERELIVRARNELLQRWWNEP